MTNAEKAREHVLLLGLISCLEVERRIRAELAELHVKPEARPGPDGAGA